MVPALESHARGIAKVLLAAGGKPTREAFSTALQTGALREAEMLLAAGADPSSGSTLLFAHSTLPEADVCMRLLRVCRNLRSFESFPANRLLSNSVLTLNPADLPTSLTSLSLHSALLAPLEPLSRLERLQALAINHCGLTELPVGVFRRMHSTLLRLDLSANKLRSLPWLPPSLQLVKLYCNYLPHIPARLVRSVPKVDVSRQLCRFFPMRHPSYETHVPTLVELALTVLDLTRHAAWLPEPLREMHQLSGLLCDFCDRTFFGKRTPRPHCGAPQQLILRPQATGG